MGLRIQDSVCTASSPFQSVISSLVSVRRKESSNKLGVLGWVVMTCSYVL